MIQNVPVLTGFALLLTLACAVTDWRRGKVYNALTYPAALLGLIASVFATPPGLLMSAAGLGACLLGFGLLWYAGGLGAGDVKLMAAVGALKGLPFVVHSCFYIICAAAVAGIFLLAWRGRLLVVSKWVALTLASAVIPGMSAPALEGERMTVPFAPFIFIGTAITAYAEIVSGAAVAL